MTRQQLWIVLVCLVLALGVLPLNAQTPDPRNPKNLPLCADLTGATNPIVRYDIPPQTVNSGGVYCRVLAQDGRFLVNSAQIGNMDALNLGIQQAVDVFAILINGSTVQSFNNPIRLCLLGTGGFFYLDATQSPRQLQQIAATVEGGYTCGSVSNAGTVMLTSSTGAVVPPPVSTLPPGVTPTAGATPGPGTPTVVAGYSGALSGCTVTTTRIVRLRAEANTTSAILDRLPYNTTWQATERVPGWIRIIWRDRQGWVSDSYLLTTGTCGS